MGDLALAALPELGRGRDFIARVHGDLIIREPRTARARQKLVVERAVREVLAPRFPDLVEAPVACELPLPLFAYRHVAGTPITPPPSDAFIAALASFVARLHAMTDVPMVIDRAPNEVVRRVQAIARERFLPQLPSAERAQYAPHVEQDVPPHAVIACPQHGDLAARNLLVDDRGALVGILDWSDSVISDPAIDFGAIAQWAGADVLDEMLARTGRSHDHALRARALVVAGVLALIDRVLG